MLRLPFPPSLNGLFNNTRRGRAKTKAYEKWINAAGMELMIQRPHKRAGAVSISIVANPPDRRKRDLDNLLKPATSLTTTQCESPASTVGPLISSKAARRTSGASTR